jgi:predicted chitinase
MADKLDLDKLKRGILTDLNKRMSRGSEDAFEKVASTEAAKAREGKGLISGAYASAKARQQVSKEYSIATRGTLGKRQAFFEGLLGRDLGDMFKNLGLEKMESPEKIKEARAKFGLDKKEKGERGAGGGVGKLAKPLSLILRKVIETQKIVRNIEKALTKPSLKSGYTFDPRMSGGGRYKNAEGKLVSSKEATTGGAAARTAALTAAIGADEDPLIKLRESLDSKLELVDKIKKDTSAMMLSLNGVTPTLGLLSVHDKLNLLIAKSALGGLPDLPNRRRTPGKTTPGKTPGKTPPGKKPPGGFSKVGKVLGGTARVLGKVAAPLAVGMAAYDAYQGATNAEETLGLKQGEKATTGQKIAAGAGSAISGLTFGLVDSQAASRFLAGYNPDEQRLISNWAYSVHIGKAKLNQVPKQLLDGVKELLKNPPKNWGKAVKPLPTKSPSIKPPASTSPPMATPKPVTTSTPGALPGASAVSTATTVATEAPASAGGAAAPSAPAPSGPPRRLGVAAAQRGKISSSEGKNAALAAAAKAGITGAHLAQFMAQLDHESGGFKTVEENLRYSAKRLLEIFPKYYKDPAQAEADAYSPIAIANRVYANRMGNGPPESGDGYKYRGRGLIQLTGKDNYKRFGQMAGIDLVSNPDLAGNLSTAADIAAAFYKKNVMDKGISAENTAKVTKAINGGSIGLSHRESLFASYSKDASSLQATQTPPGGETTEDPSMVAKGQDVKVGGDATGGPAPKQEQPMVAAAAGSVAPSGSAAAAAPPMTPVQSSTGTQVAQGSTQLESSKMVAQAAPAAPVVINNQSGPQQPISPPKQPLSKASTRSNESSFNRALAHDFSHPSAFTSVAPV